MDLARLDEEARCDGIFPLVSNDRAMTERELLLAYKQQPALERRFEHLIGDNYTSLQRQLQFRSHFPSFSALLR